jgi:hypothetical protein
MACAGEGEVIPMQNARLTVNNDAFSAEILMFTILRYESIRTLPPVS